MKHFLTLSLLAMAALLPARAAEPGEVISEFPNGIGEDYDMHYSGFYYGLDGFEYVEDQVITTTIFNGDDGYVYIQDFFAYMPTGTLIRGTADEDGVITVQLPQTIGIKDDGKYGRSWQDLEVFYSPDTETEVPVPVTDPEQNRLRFVLQDNGSIIMDELPQDCAVSVNDYSNDYPDGMWMGMSITEVTYVPKTGLYDLVTPPEGMEFKRYSYITSGMGTQPGDPEDFGYRISIGFDGDEAYIGGLSLDLPNVWVKGRREGNRVVLPSNQQMGMMGGAFNVMLQYCKKDPQAYGGYSLLPATTEFVFLYDEATDSYTTEDPNVIILINAGGENKISFLQMIPDPTLLYQPEAKGTPVAPWGLQWFARGSYNYDVFDFNLPLVSTDGVLLERENMYYRLYIDGEHWEILSEDFDSGVDMWDIPYNFDRYLIVCNRMNTAHEMGIRIDGYDTLGVQSVNVWDGVEYASEIVTIDINGSGVDSVAEEAEVVAESWFTADGVRVSKPQPGSVVIRRVERADGSVEHTKLIAR